VANRNLVFLIACVLAGCATGTGKRLPRTVEAGPPGHIPVLLELAPEEHRGDSALQDAVQECLATVLTERGWEVLGENVEAVTLESVRQQGVELDVEHEVAMIDLQKPADIHVSFGGRKFKTQEGEVFEIGMRAYQVSTSRSLASQADTGTDLDEMCQRMATQFSQDMWANGDYPKITAPHFDLVFVNPPGKFDFSMNRKLKKWCAYTVARTSVRSFVHFHTHCATRAESLRARILKTLDKPSVETHTDGESLLIFVFHSP